MYRIHVHNTGTGKAFTLYADDAEQAGDTVAHALSVNPRYRITVCRETSQ